MASDAGTHSSRASRTTNEASRTGAMSEASQQDRAAAAGGGVDSFAPGGESSRHRLPSHVSCVAAIKYGRTSSWVVLAMTDGSLRFFDVNINAQVCEFKAVERGESLVTALEACKIVTVDETNKAEESVSLLAVGDDSGKVLFLSSDNVYQQVLQNNTRASDACRMFCSQVFHHEAVRVLSYIPAMRALFVGSHAGTVAMMDLDGLNFGLTHFRKHHKSVNVIEYIDAYKYVVTAGTDRDIQVWEPRTGRGIGILRGHASAVMRMVFHEENDLLISLDKTSQVRLWNVTTETMIKSYKALVDGFLTQRLPIVDMFLARTQTGTQAGKDSLVLCCRRLRIWHLRSKIPEGSSSSQPKDTTSTALAPPDAATLSEAQDKVAAESGHEPAGIGGAQEGSDEKASKPGQRNKHPIVAVLWSAAENCILALDRSGLVCVWDNTTGKQTSCFQAERPAWVPTQTKSDNSTNVDTGQAASDPSLHKVSRSHRGLGRQKRNRRPWAETPKSFRRLKDAQRAQTLDSNDVTLLTAATLDLAQRRLVVGWSNGVVHLYNFSSGTLLQELLSEATSEIVALCVGEQKAQYSTSLSGISTSLEPNESGAYIVGAEENGVMWVWPNRANKDSKKVPYVRRLFDRDSAQENPEISEMKIGHGIIATGSSAGKLVCWSLSAAKPLCKVDDIPPHLTRTGANTCQCLLVLPTAKRETAAQGHGDWARGESVESAMVAVAGSEGVVVFSSATTGRALCQFSVGDIEYFKSASVTALACVKTGADNNGNKARQHVRLIFVGDSNGKLYTFDVQRLLYPKEESLAIAASAQVTKFPHARHPPHSSHIKKSNPSHKQAVKLFESQAYDSGICSIVVIPFVHSTAGWARTQEEDSNLFALAVSTLDGSVSLWASNLEPVAKLNSTAQLQKLPQFMSKLSAAADACSPESVTNILNAGNAAGLPVRILCVSVLSIAGLMPFQSAALMPEGGQQFHFALFLDKDRCAISKPTAVASDGQAVWDGVAHHLRVDDEKHRGFGLMLYRTDAASIQYCDDEHSEDNLNQVLALEAADDKGLNESKDLPEEDMDANQKQVMANMRRMMQRLPSEDRKVDVDSLQGQELGAICIPLHTFALHSDRLDWFALDLPSQLHKPPKQHQSAGPCDDSSSPMVQLKFKMTTLEQIEKENEDDTDVTRKASAKIISWWRKRQKNRNSIGSWAHQTQQEADEQVLLKTEDGQTCQYASKLLLQRIHLFKGKWWPPPDALDRMRWYLNRRPVPAKSSIAATSTSNPIAAVPSAGSAKNEGPQAEGTEGHNGNARFAIPKIDLRANKDDVTHAAGRNAPYLPCPPAATRTARAMQVSYMEGGRDSEPLQSGSKTERAREVSAPTHRRLVQGGVVGTSGTTSSVWFDARKSEEGTASRPKSVPSIFKNVPGVALGRPSPRVDNVAQNAEAEAIKHDSFGYGAFASKQTQSNNSAVAKDGKDNFVPPQQDVLPGSVLALKLERQKYKVTYGASATVKAKAAPPPAPPSWRRQGADRYSGSFVRASGLPVPPNERDPRKRLSGLSLYALDDTQSADKDTSPDLWGLSRDDDGIRLTRSAHGLCVLTGDWRQRERERERVKEKAAHKVELQEALKRKKGEERWAKAPSEGGVASASAAALDDYFTSALKSLRKKSALRLDKRLS